MTDLEPTRGRVGRPRRFDEVTERELLVDAGLRVMRRNGYSDASVAEILQTAGVSSRAFYRHFETKDALLLAIFRRDGAAVAAGLGTAVHEAGGGVAALDAWLDEFLDLFCRPGRAARVALLASAAARRAEGFDEAMEWVRGILTAPLTEALERGAADEVLHTVDADQDARTILAVTESVTGTLLATGGRWRPQARAHVLRFCWPALGLDPV